MIGHLIGAYCDGRRDARHGPRRPRDPKQTSDVRLAYLAGYRDEAARMRERGELQQVSIALELPE